MTRFTVSPSAFLNELIYDTPKAQRLDRSTMNCDRGRPTVDCSGQLDERRNGNGNSSAKARKRWVGRSTREGWVPIWLSRICECQASANVLPLFRAHRRSVSCSEKNTDYCRTWGSWLGSREFPPRLSILFDRSIELLIASPAIWSLVTLCTYYMLRGGVEA